MAWKRLYWSSVTVSAFFLAVMVVVNGYLSTLYNNRVEQPMVEGVPATALPHPGEEPAYTGPHPALLSRPEDPFQYPIPVGGTGPVASLFSGPLQYPFLCGVASSGLGQPVVDNTEQLGIPVYRVDPETGQMTHVITGYSKDCQIPTRILYFYKRRGVDQFLPFTEEVSDARVDTLDWHGQTIPFVVRIEVGTINRFIYVLAALKGPMEKPADKHFTETPDTTFWNQRLVYHFRGGVGIGKRQGNVSVGALLDRNVALLQRGYAVAYSTGTQTSNHYNMWLAEEVALRVKRQFEARYGKPQFTLGIGGSGGAIQQLLIGQNHPGLLDGALALYAYPDMITQTIYALDCEPLEYYIDVKMPGVTAENEWRLRKQIQGLNAEPHFSNKFTPYYSLAHAVWGEWPPIARGMSECVNGWRGLGPLVNNPRFTHLAKYYDPKVFDRVHWTHWDDLRHIYGVRESGFARQTWDNVGVQYGLRALQEGDLTPDAFLALNRNVGGWKPPEAFQNERYWKIIPGTNLFEFSPWGQHNLWQTTSDRPAPRTHGDRAAIKAAFQSGHVFVGKIDIPVLDLRHYLEHELNMHHLSASFSIRQRIRDFAGSFDQHVLWVVEEPYQPIGQAMDLLDEWVVARTKRPDRSIAASRPETLEDACFDGHGKEIAGGPNVWDGEWNGKATGACLQAYPAYRTSRIVAGGDWEGDEFKCALKSIDQALADGDYGSVDMTPYQDDLTKIFPEGVCDYRVMSAEKAAVLAELRQPKALQAPKALPAPVLTGNSKPSSAFRAREAVAALRVE